MKKAFTLPAYEDERKLFRSYVELIKPFLHKIKPRELDVFAELLYRHHTRKDIPNPKDRMSLILAKDCRDDMVEQLNMTHPIFRNAISSLRKYNYLKEGNIISDVFLLAPKDGKLDLTFTFTLKDKA